MEFVGIGLASAHRQECLCHMDTPLISSRSNVKGLTKERVRDWLQRRYALRVHMLLIVAATIGAGLGATKLLLMAHVDVLALRYALAVFAAYLTFLFLIRIWLAYVSDERWELDFNGDGVDIFSWGGPGPGPTGLDGGGGSFGGGGASGSWGDAAAQPVKSSGGSGFDLVPDLDGEGCVLVLLAAALIAILLVAGVYLIYTAPAILSEVAFETVLAAALARRAKRVASSAWVGSIFRATVWIFAAVLAFSVALGWYAQKRCPEAKRLKDAIECKAGISRNLRGIS
jgi:lysylphosphatidylglycerol synthetase-like protein (DUF2156 family)